MAPRPRGGIAAGVAPYRRHALRMNSPVLPLRLFAVRLCAALALACLPFSSAAESAPPASPVSSINGGFEAAGLSSSWPAGWAVPDAGASRWETSPEGRFISLRASPGQVVMSRHSLALRPEWKALEVGLRARCSRLVLGSAPWHEARVEFEFSDAAQRKISSGRAISLRADTEGWVARRIRFAVPPGAVRLEILPALLNVKQGTFDLDDVTVEVVDPRSLSSAKGSGGEAIESPGPATAFRDRWPSELRVAGNRLHDRSGKEVWLQGVNVVSLEWLATGEHLFRALEVAMGEWRSNVVRLPVTEKFWFGQGPKQADGGFSYRARVDEAVAAAAGRGAYLVLDLHGFGAPAERHAEFWKDAASRYRNHPAVLFDLFNEPNSIPWETWRDGGFVPDPAKPADARGAASASPPGFQSTGMQRLVDVVRETGARNLVIAGGLDWSYDLTGIAKGFALKEKGGNGVMYSAHIYSWKRDWDANVMVVAKDHPVFIGEVGCDVTRMSFVPPERHESPYTWAPDMLGYIQKHRLNWTAFSFHPTASPVLISDWKFTPTPFWGEFVKRALAGTSFELKNTR